MAKKKSIKKAKPVEAKAPVESPKEPTKISISNCNFEMKVEDNKGEHMNILADATKALLNITEFFKGKQVKVESLVKITSNGIDMERCNFKNDCKDKESVAMMID